MEEQNDDAIDSLRNKVNALRGITIDINDEIKNQKHLIRTMDDEFDSTEGLLAGSMRRVQRLASGGHNRYIFYLILFAVFVFLYVYYVIRSR